MTNLPFHLVDVFTESPVGGNQLAVVIGGEGLSTETMQNITREFNFSETTFVLPPADPKNNFRLRIFTPGTELPMAGHPTVGTSYVLAREGMVTASGSEANIRLEEGVGPIPVRIEFEGGKPVTAHMSQPLPTFGPRFEDRSAIAELLSLDPSDIVEDLPLEVVSCGVPFLYVPLKSLEAIRRVRLRHDVWERALGGKATEEVFMFTREVENQDSTVHSRMFAPAMGVAEDAATGAASGPLGCYLVRYGLVPREATAHIVSEQGFEMGRPSIIRIEIDSRGDEITGVRVGGRCRYWGSGTLELE